MDTYRLLASNIEKFTNDLALGDRLKFRKTIKAFLIKNIRLNNKKLSVSV